MAWAAAWTGDLGRVACLLDCHSLPPAVSAGRRSAAAAAAAWAPVLLLLPLLPACRLPAGWATLLSHPPPVPAEASQLRGAAMPALPVLRRLLQGPLLHQPQLPCLPHDGQRVPDAHGLAMSHAAAAAPAAPHATSQPTASSLALAQQSGQTMQHHCRLDPSMHEPASQFQTPTVVVFCAPPNANILLRLLPPPRIPSLNPALSPWYPVHPHGSAAWVG